MRIVFVGLDGCGKSTQVGLLHDWFASSGVPAKIVDKWQIHDHSRYPEHRFLGVDREELRLCIAEMQAPSRALFLFWSIAATLPNPMLGDVVYLFDGYWQKHAASEVAYGCDGHWIAAASQVFPVADLTFYFELEPALALERKRDSLTPYECGRKQLTGENFLSHQLRVRRILEERFLTQGSKEVVRVDASRRPAEVFAFLCENLASRLTQATPSSVAPPSKGALNASNA